MRHKDEVLQRAETLRLQRVERDYKRTLEDIDRLIEEDINERFPKGFVVVPVSIRSILDSGGERQQHDLSWYLEKLNYNLALGAESPRDRTVDLIVRWRKL